MRTRLDFLISKGRRDSCVDPQLFRSCGSRVPLSLNASSYLVNQQSLSRDNFSLFTTAFILSFSSRKIRASSFVPRRRNVSPSLPQNKSNEERRSRGSKVGKRIRENSIRNVSFPIPQSLFLVKRFRFFLTAFSYFYPPLASNKFSLTYSITFYLLPPSSSLPPFP